MGEVLSKLHSDGALEIPLIAPIAVLRGGKEKERERKKKEIEKSEKRKERERKKRNKTKISPSKP